MKPNLPMWHPEFRYNSSASHLDSNEFRKRQRKRMLEAKKDAAKQPPPVQLVKEKYAKTS